MTDASAEPLIRIVDRQLVIDGEPLLVLAGEFRNSAVSTIERVDDLWQTAEELNLNTALIAIAWDLFEPEEGIFDYEILDAVIQGAAERDLKLVLLWFGSWKNGLSSYRPSWMKHDPERFPLVQTADGARLGILSAFSTESRDADARAFGALMRRVREIDQTQTVVMVQVENEVGILGSSRDHSALARQAWEAPVDSGLVQHLRANPQFLHPEIADAVATDVPSGANWEQTFGSGVRTDEVFQAFATASYLEAISAAGRAEHDIPQFTNAWLNRLAPSMLAGVPNPFGGADPGEYPSGGPVGYVFPVWKYAAPTIDLLVPDLYSDDFAERCELFASANDALFIPEMRRNRFVLGDIFVAIGGYSAIGTSPFGVDGVAGEIPDETRALIAEAYERLAEMSEVILSAQRRGEITGFRLNPDVPEHRVTLAGARLRISRDMERDPMPEAPESWGLVAVDDDGRLVGIGSGFRVTFEAIDDSRHCALDRVETGRYENGRWKLERVLNGDETISGEQWRFPYMQIIPGLAWGLGSAEIRVSRCTLFTY